MAWRFARGAAGRYREIVLAAVFVGMAGWELLEIWTLERPLESGVSLTVLLHALQVVLILGVSFALLRAWQEKTAHEQALARMVEKVVFAQEDERRRIAYDLHDGIAQLVVSAKQHVDTCGDLWDSDSPRAARELAKGLDRLQRAIAETRRVLVALRPSAVDSIGLVAAVRSSLDEAAQEAGWTVGFTENLRGIPLPPAVETAVFRIIQEALANASRHAATSRLDLDLRREQGWLTLDVRDCGVGFVASSDRANRQGLGLVSMRERAQLLGGTCAIESQPGHGTRICVRLPLGNGQAGGHAA